MVSCPGRCFGLPHEGQIRLSYVESPTDRAQLLYPPLIVRNHRSQVFPSGLMFLEIHGCYVQLPLGSSYSSGMNGY